MAGKVVSIEIGYSLTKVCEVDYKKKAHKVYKSFTIPTVEGVINDGILKVDRHYVEALRSGLQEHRIHSKQIVFSIASSKIASREITIPFVKENRIGDVVRANAMDYFPVDLSQYQLAYSILGILGEEKGRQQYKLLVLATPTAVLDGYYELAAALRLEIAAIDYAANSIFQAVKKECATGTQLVVKMDERSTMIMAVKEQTIVFTRNVSYGVDEALQVVKDSQAWGDIWNIGLAIEAVQKNRCIDLLVQEREDVGELSKEEKARMDVTDALLPLAGGIARVVDYYVSRNSDSPIEKVLITGIGSHFQGIEELLRTEINYPIEVLKKVEGLNLERYFKEGAFGEYLACIGATIEPMGLKREVEKGKGKGKSKDKKKSGEDASGSKAGEKAAYSCLVAGLLVSAGLVGYSVAAFLDAAGTNVELQHQVTELMPIIEIYNEYIGTKEEYNEITAIYEETASRNDTMYEFFTELEQKLPADVNVIAFSCDRESISISMRVSTKGEAAATVEQMRTFSSLLPESVSVTALSTEEMEESNEVINFTVSALYAPLDQRVEETEEETEPAAE